MKQYYDREHCSMKLSQEANIDKLLIRYKMKNFNTNSTHMDKNLTVSREGEAIQELKDCIANGLVAVKYVSTDNLLTDLITNPVDAVHM